MVLGDMETAIWALVAAAIAGMHVLAYKDQKRYKRVANILYFLLMIVGSCVFVFVAGWAYGARNEDPSGWALIVAPSLLMLAWYFHFLPKVFHEEDSDPDDEHSQK